MKRSIKVATLTFFVTSLLAGCSSAGPAPVAQEITVNPESKVTTLDKSFELSTNASTATWSLEDNLCGALLSATEGKSVSVSAPSVGTVDVVAAASGYTTEKVTLTFNPLVQEITVNPASAKVYLDESFELETNLASANWTLQDNNTGASLSAESGKSVTISGAVTAGTLKAVATAEGATTAEVLLTFEALKPQNLSTDPKSKEVFKGKAITVTTDASSAGWSLENNTASAKLISSAQGKSVTIQGDSVGTVDVVAKSEHYADARVTLSFVEPHWTDEEKAAMASELYGEVLAYPLGAGDLSFIQDDGIFVIGQTISVKDLAAYASNFTDAEGWKLVEKSEEDPIVYYCFEKEVLVNEERRFINVLFGSLDAGWEDFEENGFLYLQASDPYLYSAEDVVAAVEDVKAKQGIKSDIEIPVPAGHHYEVSGSAESGRLYCYEVEKGEHASVAELYSETLLATEDFILYPFDPVFGGYVAEEKSGAYSLIYAAIGESTLVVLIRKGATYVSQWPTEAIAALVTSLGSEVVIPVFEAERYNVEQYDANIGPVININCYGFSSDKSYAGYIDLLEGWTLFGEFDFGEEGKPEYYYLANSADGKVGVQVTLNSGVLSIYVAPRNFDADFPTAYFEYIIAMLGVESEYQIPVLPAGGYEFEADYDEEEPVVMAYCFGVENPEEAEDGGYSKILEAAGWITGVVDVYDEKGAYEFSYYVADSPDHVYGIQWIYNEADNYAAIYLSLEPYFYYAWPSDLIEYVTQYYFWSTDYIPEIKAEYYEFDWNFGILICYGVEASEEAPDAGYGALLEKADFTLMGEREQEEFSYWTANSPEGYFGSYGVAYWVDGDVLYVQYTDAWLETYDKFPAKPVDEFYSSLGEEGVIVPEYVIAAEGSSFEISRDYEYYGMLIVFANLSTSEELKAFEDKLVLAGWNLVPAEEEATRAEEEEEEIYSAMYQFGESNAYIEVYDYSAEGYVTLVFEYVSPLLDQFPSAEVAEYLESLGYKDMIPEYIGEATQLSWDDYYKEVEVVVSDVESWMSDYESILEAADFTYYGDYSDAHGGFGYYYASPNEEYLVVVYSYDLGGLYIGFTNIPEPVEWPEDEVAAALAAAGFTDSLPAFTGVATEIEVYKSQIEMFVDSGNELDSIDSYQKELLKAGYTELGPDDYGDMHYLSPNGEIDVCVWNGADYDYAGYVFIDFKAYVAPVAEFPLAEVNSFLSENELGFQLSEGLVDPSKEGFIVEYDVYVIYYYEYPYVEITVSGDAFDQDVALIEAVILDAGYELDEDESEEGLNVYYNNNYSMVSIEYDAEDDKTIVVFMA